MSLTRFLPRNLPQLFEQPWTHSPLPRLATSVFNDPFFKEAFGNLPAAFKQMPALDMKETDKSYVVEMDAPGITRDQLSLEFVNPNTLVIKGKYEKASKTPETSEASETRKGPMKQETGKTEIMHQAERLVGEFQRSVVFPGVVNSENVKASLRNGVLTVSIPKVEEQRGTKITIEE